MVWIFDVLIVYSIVGVASFSSTNLARWKTSPAYISVPANPFINFASQSVSSSPRSNYGRPLWPSTWSSQRRLRCCLYMSVPNLLDTFTSGLASICRLPGGVTVDGTSRRKIMAPEDELQRPVLKRLYDIENSIACRPVRERLTELDVVVEKIIPAPKNSRAVLDADYEYALESPEIKVPTLIASIKMTNESKQQQIMLSGTKEILNFLDEHFVVTKLVSAEDDLKNQVIALLREVGGLAASLLRIGRGDKVASVAAIGSQAPRPKQPLILYSYESNQFCRLVREVLTELDIVYELRSVGKESPRRAEMAKTTGGTTQCPFIVDPNTGVAMAESSDIILYLYQTYALYAPPNELLQWVSDLFLPLVKPIFAFLTPVQAGSFGADKDEYTAQVAAAKVDIEKTVAEHSVVIYTYGLSPFSSEATALLNRLNISYKEISLGAEWIPGLIKAGGSQTRAALLEMTGQSSLPHVFIGGQSIGGLFSGTPGLVPALNQGILRDTIAKAMSQPQTSSSVLPETKQFDVLGADVGSFE